MSTLPGWPGDNFYFLWQNRWLREAILAGQNPLDVPAVFVPDGYNLARDDMTLLTTVPAALLGGLVGDILAYNIVLVLGSVLAGLIFIRWAERLGASRSVALVLGLALVLLPYRSIRTAGHTDLVTVWPITLTLLLLDQAIDKGARRSWILAGLAFAACGLAAWYYAPAFALVLPWYALVRAGGIAGWWRRDRIVGLIWFAAAAVLVLIPAATPYFRQAGPGVFQHTLRLAIDGSASPPDYLVPGTLHPWFGGFTRAYFENHPFFPVERAISPGIVVIGLALVGLVARRDRQTGALLGLAAAAFILSLGPAVKWLNSPVLIAWPAQIADRVLAVPGVSEFFAPPWVQAIRSGQGFIPLPAIVVNLWLPFGQALRVWSRLGIFVDVALLGLAALGLSHLKWHWAAPVAGTVILFELLAVGLPASVVAARPVDGWLRANDDGRPIMVYPLANAAEPREMWAQFDHRRPIVHGHATFPGLTFRLGRPKLDQFPNGEAIDFLGSLGVRQIVVLPESYGPRWPEIRDRLSRQPLLRRAIQLEGAEVWEIVP